MIVGPLGVSVAQKMLAIGPNIETSMWIGEMCWNSCFQEGKAKEMNTNQEVLHDSTCSVTVCFFEIGPQMDFLPFNLVYLDWLSLWLIVKHQENFHQISEEQADQSYENRLSKLHKPNRLHHETSATSPCPHSEASSQGHNSSGERPYPGHCMDA